MSQDILSFKKQRTINAVVKGKVKKIAMSYLLSFSFMYMISFSFLHYFAAATHNFFSAFGVVLIDVMASILYYSLYLKQFKQNEINQIAANKKRDKPYTNALLYKNMNADEFIASFKIGIFLFFCSWICSKNVFLFFYIFCCIISDSYLID